MNKLEVDPDIGLLELYGSYALICHIIQPLTNSIPNFNKADHSLF